MGSSNLFVISTTALNEDTSPRICYENLASTSSSIVASHDNSNTDRLYDGMTTLAWIPANASPNIQFNGTFLNTDFLGLAGANWAAAGCSIALRDQSGNLLATATGMKDNQPVLFVFTKTTYTALKVEFTCSNTLLEVGEISFGEAMTLPRKVSIGYRPGRWSTNDIVTRGRTEQNQFAGSVIRQRGNTEVFKVGLVPTSFMEDEYLLFVRCATGLAVFFIWNSTETTQAVYGTWEDNAPVFNSSLLSEINITITGVA